MGRPIRGVSYDAATNTLSGNGVHTLPVRIFVYAADADKPGAVPLFTFDATIGAGDGKFNVELDGLAAATAYSVRWAPRDIPLHAAWGQRLNITTAAPVIP